MIELEEVNEFTSPEPEVFTNTSPDAVIDYTQSERLKLYAEEANIKNKLALLDGLSFVALSTKKIKVDTANSASNREIAVTLANMLKNSPNPAIEDSSYPPIYAPELPNINLVYEESSIGLAQIDYHDIVKNKD